MSKDMTNPFAMPGDDRHKKADINPSANKDIFQKPTAGGGGSPKRKPEPKAEPEIEQIPYTPSYSIQGTPGQTFQSEMVSGLGAFRG